MEERKASLKKEGRLIQPMKIIELINSISLVSILVTLLHLEIGHFLKIAIHFVVHSNRETCNELIDNRLIDWLID